MFTVPEFFQQLNSASKWLVLWAVYREPGLTGRKVAKKAGLSWAPVKATLDWLLEEGFIYRKKQGRRYYYFPKQEHFLYPILQQIFALIESLGKRFFQELSEKVFAPQATLLTLKMSYKRLFLVIKGDLKGLNGKLSNYLENNAVFCGGG